MSQAQGLRPAQPSRVLTRAGFCHAPPLSRFRRAGEARLLMMANHCLPCRLARHWSENNTATLAGILFLLFYSPPPKSGLLLLHHPPSLQRHEQGRHSLLTYGRAAAAPHSHCYASTSYDGHRVFGICGVSILLAPACVCSHIACQLIATVSPS